MALQCNIDSHGAHLRRIWGWSNLIAALALTVAGFWLAWLWIIAAFAAAMGLFGLFEARHKWCAVRALGIKTPM